MKQLSLIVSLLFISIYGYSQNSIVQKYATEINAQLTKKHLSILASDKFEGRETGKRGAEMAATYIAKEFKKLKLIAPLNGSYFQNVELIETSMRVNSFVANNHLLKAGEDFLFNGSGEAKVIEAAEIIFLTDAATAENISDKVVLIIRKTGVDITKSLKSINSKSPALIIIAGNNEVDTGPEQHSAASLSVKNGSRESLPMRENKPAIIRMNPGAAMLILEQSGRTYEELAANGSKSEHLKAKIKLDYTPVKRELKSANILGLLEGTDLKEELLVYSAHYDHIGMNKEGSKDKVFNGADDNASGTSGVLAIAKAFAKAKEEGHGPRRSVLFILFTGEEKNILGSEYYSLNPVFPMANTIGNLNIDMIGRIDYEYQNSPDSTNYIYLVGSSKLSTELHSISDSTNKVYSKLKIDYRHDLPSDRTQIYYWSDHYNFARYNVPVIFYYNGKHDDYHKGTDEISKINFELLSKRAQLAYYTGWVLANRDQRPALDIKPNDK